MKIPVRQNVLQEQLRRKFSLSSSSEVLDLAFDLIAVRAEDSANTASDVIMIKAWDLIS